MVMHMMVAIAKLHLHLSSHTLRPVVAGLAYPVVLKLFISSFRLFRDEALHQSRLFLFRISHIFFNREVPLSIGARLEHAVRLMLRVFATSIATTYEGLVIGHNTFHDLSMVTL
ncbi:hypothetical protein Lal_00029964 [Lupinus albus]|uniref:Uncharacterized protein n=1 Tax=Lupinus albus TaxID=3870 RepID=A0A6A5MMM5_LUPAL|nr:hypothetical protein Lalb_Chr16g0386661 [Lupinus albus]KAF1874537.1 hypothetical protein Lal_00029964 [Lupinus albus]